MAAGAMDANFGDGGLVTADFTGPGSDDIARQVAVVQADQKLVVIGSSYQGQTSQDFAVARYNSDGSLDASFGIDGRVRTDFSAVGGGLSTDYPTSVALQTDGKIVVAGISNRGGSLGNDVVLARYNSDGSLDASFGDGGKVRTDLGSDSDQANGLAIAPDGRIVVAGATRRSTTVFALVRYNPDGSLDDGGAGDATPGDAFGVGGKVTSNFQSRGDVAYSVGIQSNGRIVAAGYAPIMRDGRVRVEFAMAGYLHDGGIDTSFGDSGKVTTHIGGMFDWAEAYEMAIQPDDKVVLAGRGRQGLVLARYSASGSLDDGFGDGGKVMASLNVSAGGGNGLALLPNGSLVVGGTTSFARFTASGKYDTALDGDGIVATGLNGYNSWLSGVAAQADGRIVVAATGGSSIPAPSSHRDFLLLRYNVDGSLDDGGAADSTPGDEFGVDGQVTTDIGWPLGNGASQTIVQPDGKLVVAGGASGDFMVSRYNGDGSLDDGGAGDTSPGDSFGVGGKLIIDFGSQNDQNPSIALQPDGKIVLTGISWRPGTNWDIALARIESDGVLDASFGSGGLLMTDLGSDEFAVDLDLQPDGKILVTGTSRVNGDDDFLLVRYNADGGLDASFDSDGWLTLDFGDSYDGAEAVAVQPDGKIVLAGWTYPADLGDFALARFNSDGSLDDGGALDATPGDLFGVAGKTTIDLGGADDGAYDVAIRPDGKIVAAGYSYSNGLSDFALVQLNADGGLDTGFHGDGWTTTDFGTSDDWLGGMAIQVDGKIVVAGGSTQGSVTQFALARYDAAGELDSAFDGDGMATFSFGSQYDMAKSVVIQDDGMIVVTGATYQRNGDVALARLHGYDLAIGGSGAADAIVVEPGAQAGTLKVTVNGQTHDNLSASGELFIYGLGGADTITVNASLAGGVVVAGQGGDDRYTVNFGLLAGSVQVADGGAAGTDVLTVRGTPGDDEIFKDASSVLLLSPSQQTVLATGVESRIIRGGGGDDLITDPGSDTFLYGDEGNDTLVVTATEGSGVFVDGGEGSDSYIIVTGALHGPVVIDDTGAVGQDSAVVQSGAGDDTIVQSPSGLTVNEETIVFSSNLEAVAIDGGGGDDSFESQGVAAVSVQLQNISEMVVRGTQGDDTIVFSPGRTQGEVVARMNGAEVVRFSPTQRITAFGGAGNDNIQVTGGLTLPAWLYGESGSDRLKGGAGHDVLLGGDGDDFLAGDGGRDLLIGGAGADRIVGNADDDILIAGMTDHDGNDAALALLMKEWTRQGAAFAERVSRLENGGGENQGYLLSSSTVHDDRAEDVLTGSSGADWFLFNRDGDVRDRATDLSTFESLFAEDIAWLSGGA